MIANDLYLELSAAMLQLEQREKELLKYEFSNKFLLDNKFEVYIAHKIFWWLFKDYRVAFFMIFIVFGYSLSVIMPISFMISQSQYCLK